ncbi:MAG: hypothetical protein U0840_25095 [Gemmataceae bacterium]
MQELPGALPWYRNPLVMGLIGLALMVGGWKLTSFVPPRPSESTQAEQLAGLRRMSDDEALNERLDRIAAGVRREPPLQIPGRLAFLAGLTSFTWALLQMARTPIPAEEQPAVGSSD